MECRNMNWTVKTLCNQMKKGTINFDCAVQRSKVWDNDRKSLLMHSAAYGYKIPSFDLRKNEDGGDFVYNALDGKQRSNAFFEFLNGEFALNEDTPVVYDEDGNEEDISGCYFDGLPEWVQDRIKDCSLTFYYFEGMTDEEEREYFMRKNNGKPLTAVELMRVKARSIEDYKEIANHAAITASMTTRGKQGKADEMVAMQIHAMDTMDNVSFEKKTFGPWLENKVMTAQEKEDIYKGLEYMENIFSTLKSALEADPKNANDKRVYRKVKTRINFVAIAYGGILAARAGIAPEKFTTAVYNFFNDSMTTTTSKDYNTTLGAGTGKAENVQKRKAAIQEFVKGLEG